jgi:hypothetical protein
MKDKPAKTEEQVFRVAVIIAGLAVLCVALVMAWTIWVVSTQFVYWQEILRHHFAAVIGLPGAAIVAFVLVVFLRQTDGPIEFEAIGLKFKGAAGQVMMWVITFLAMAVAIKLVW